MEWKKMGGLSLWVVNWSSMITAHNTMVKSEVDSDNVALICVSQRLFLSHQNSSVGCREIKEAIPAPGGMYSTNKQLPSVLLHFFSGYAPHVKCLSLLSKPLDHDKWRIFLPHYLILWECQSSASRPVNNRGDMAGWSRTRVQGALALDTQRAWACPRSHTVPGDDVMSHAPALQQRLCLVSSLLCPELGLLLRPQRAWMPGWPLGFYAQRHC